MVRTDLGAHGMRLPLASKRLLGGFSGSDRRTRCTVASRGNSDHSLVSGSFAWLSALFKASTKLSESYGITAVSLLAGII